MKEISDSLQYYLRDQHNLGIDGSLYRAIKPKICANHIFPKSNDLLTDPNAYGRFQQHLQEIASVPKGLNLALSLMVEVNVALGILLHSKTEMALELQERISHGDFILATGVSEPGWDGSLKKIKSHLSSDLKLTGTKSFITNGGSADAILWVTYAAETFPVYLVKMKDQDLSLKSETIGTPFLKHVSHIKLTADHLQLQEKDLVLSDYRQLGTELRLKELFSLVSLLLGYVEGIPRFHSYKELYEEWKILRDWRNKTSSGLLPDNYLSVLEEAFPFPITGLLQALAKFYGIKDTKDLPTQNPDLMIFLWEDQFTKYLLLRKNKSNRS